MARGESPHDATERLSAIQRIQEEIRTLTDEQHQALLMAVYLGMSADEARVYDTRRKKIASLFLELTQLEQNDRSNVARVLSGSLSRKI